MAIDLTALKSSLKIRVTVLTLAVFLGSIWSLGYFAVSILKNDLKKLLGEQQFSTASIVAADMDQEIDFRLRALESIAKTITPTILNTPSELQDILEDRPVFKNLFNAGYYATAADGMATASVPSAAGRVGVNFLERDHVAAALKEGRTTVSKPVIGKMLKTPVISMAAPIRNKDGGVIGALVGVVDLQKPNFINKITDYHYGKTGGYVLIAPQHKLIVTATDKSRIMQPIPATGVNPLMDRYINGFEGFGSVVDSRGLEVLSAAKQIPAAGWVLVARISTQEAFAPIRKMQKSIQIAAMILTILAGGLTWWILRRQLSPMLDVVETLSTLSGAGVPMKPLPIVRRDEVGQLIGSFNHLLESLAAREARLLESEEHHRSILKTAMSGIWLTDTRGHLLEVNESYCIMSGYSESELLAMKIADLDINYSPEDIITHIQLLKEKTGQRFETKHQRKDGTLIDVDISAQYRDVDGGQCVVFVQDITERKRMEQALKEERHRLTGIIKGTNVGTWEWNVQTGETIFNERWAGIIGYTLEEIAPVSIETWMKYAHPDDLKASSEVLEKHFRGELDYYEVESRMKHKDGSWAWVLDRGKVAAWTEDGKPLLMMGTHQDITRRKNAEEEKAIMQSQLHQAQKMESVGRLAGGVAHDFNNMLTIIAGYSQLGLVDSEAGSPLRSYFREINKTADRSADLTRQLLAFARKQTIAPKVLELNDSVASMLKMLQRLIGEDIHLTWRPAPELWQIKADPSQIDQILANLCVNARDAVENSGGISIESRNSIIDSYYCANHPDAAPGEYVRLSVSDNGRGMDKATLALIFEPFYTTKEMGKGTGLGLATVFGIVKQNCGFINVYSEPGQGTTFSIYFPRHHGNASQALPEAEPPPTSHGNETILLVEDEPSTLIIAAMMLEKQGYNVLKAGNSGDAFRIAEDNAGNIQLLMTDVIMPEVNGKDLATTILSNNPDMKCLFMSGYTSDVIAQHGVLDEGVNFIQKPFSLADLAVRIREVLDRCEI